MSRCLGVSVKRSSFELFLSIFLIPIKFFNKFPVTFGVLSSAHAVWLKSSNALTILTRKICVYSIQHKNSCLTAFDLFHIFTQSISFIHSITRIKEYRCLKNVIHQIGSKNERLLLSASFTAKLGLVLALALENALS